MYDLRNIHMLTDNTFSIFMSINNRHIDQPLLSVLV